MDHASLFPILVIPLVLWIILVAIRTGNFRPKGQASSGRHPPLRSYTCYFPFWEQLRAQQAAYNFRGSLPKSALQIHIC
jgi:hypothetical protein